MKNLELLKQMKEKIENLRLEIIETSIDLDTTDENYDLIFDTLSEDVESSFCNLLNDFDSLISEIN
jgi:hypothetical protein